ncbi:MAG: hypothetical protein R3B13_21815 [Polyangiaceae bacterium]
MSDEHLSEDTLVAYVMDHLDALNSKRVEAHVASCERCAAALEREAKLEVACGELAADLSRVPPAIVARPVWRAPLLAGLAAAAAAALVVAWQGSRPPAERPLSAAASPEASRHPVTHSGATATPAPLATGTMPPGAASGTPAAPASQAAAKCSAPIQGLVEALAIPQGSSGDIELVLTNHPASCSYWADKRFENACDVWRTRITITPAMQKPGSYRVDHSFAYLDQRSSSSAGAWQKGSVCKRTGGDLHGTLRIDRIEQDRIIGSICGSSTSFTPNPNLVDGHFVARRCPACASTGDSCKSDADCCTNACVQGRCIP